MQSTCFGCKQWQEFTQSVNIVALVVDGARVPHGHVLNGHFGRYGIEADGCAHMHLHSSASSSSIQLRRPALRPTMSTQHLHGAGHLMACTAIAIAIIAGAGHSVAATSIFEQPDQPPPAQQAPGSKEPRSTRERVRRCRGLILALFVCNEAHLLLPIVNHFACAF